MLPKDIIARVNRDFVTPEDAALALSVLADFVDQNPDLASDRIIRCIVFVAKGDLDTLERAIDLANTDYRDLIMWAEYDDNSNRIRDLSDSFS